MIGNWILKRRLQDVGTKSDPSQGSRHYIGHSTGRSDNDPPFSHSSPTSERLRQLLDARHARAFFFGSHHFANPTWDILLLAYVALLEGKQLTVSNVCRDSIVPDTSTLRWISALEQEGWLFHRGEPLGSPRCWLELSATGKLGMQRYFEMVWPTLSL